MRVLVIEPDAATRAGLELMLGALDFTVAAAADVEEGLAIEKCFEHDAIIAEAQFPKAAAFSAVRALRAAKVKAPIILLTALGRAADIAAGLGMGADDYVTKPFHRDELVARIGAVVRRWNGHAQSTIECGELVIDLDNKRVSVAGTHVHFTRKQFALLETLALRQGQTVTKDSLLTRMYGGRDEPDIKIIDVMVSNIRTKLRAVSNGREFIETVWGVGYTLPAAPFIPAVPGRMIAPISASWPGGPTRSAAPATA